MSKVSHLKDAKRRKVYTENSVQWVKPSIVDDEPNTEVREPGTFERYVAWFKQPYGVRKITGFYSDDPDRGILTPRCFHEQYVGGEQLHCAEDVYPTYAEAREDYVRGIDWRIKQMLENIQHLVEANRPES